MIDFALHPLHVAEARFIMQNRRKSFAVYQSLPDFFKKSSKEMFRGILLHIPRNICIAMSKIRFDLIIIAGMKLTDQMNIYYYYVQSIVL